MQLAAMLSRPVLSGLVLVPLLGAIACHHDDPDDEAPVGCADLVTTPLGESDLVITSAREVPASSTAAGSAPAHCLVSGNLAARQGLDGKPYAIGFELKLPLADYNQRLVSPRHRSAHDHLHRFEMTK